METDSATDSWKWILLLDDIPGSFKIFLGNFLDESNDIISCRTGRTAGRGLILIKRTLCSPCPRLIPFHIPQRNGDHGHIRGTFESELFGHLICPKNLILFTTPKGQCDYKTIQLPDYLNPHFLIGFSC